MTASASVVEALRRIAARPLQLEPGRGDYGSDRIRCPSCSYAWEDSQAEKHSATCDRQTALAALNAPHPAEQDAREAVAWRWRKTDQGFGPGYWEYGSEPIKGASPGYYEIEPLYTALTQAAPDGWVLMPVEPTDAMLEAGGDRVGWNPAPRIKAAGIYRAMLSASPSPPAQGAGG